jgi:hypothetical protein
MTTITRNTVKLNKTSRALMRRSLRLLDMEYKPSEIADELNTNPQYILRLVGSGAPARKDTKGRFWIHGESFARWLADASPKNIKELKARPTIAENETYCLRCKAITTYTETTRRRRISFGTCPQGHKVSRFLSNKKPTGKPTTNERKAP